MQNDSVLKAIVIGGGIIGVTSAINLLKRGYQVTLVEKEAIAAGASTGNCGLMAVSEIVPVSKPGVMTQVPGWLMDPEGPISIRPLHAISMIPWFMKFIKAGSKENVQKVAHGLTQLSNQAAAAYAPLLAEAGLTDILKPYEVIYLFDEKSELDHDPFSWQLREQYGFQCDFLDSDALRQTEPEISQHIECGMLMKGWDYFSDPARLTKRLAAYFVELGGKITLDQVKTINTDSSRITSIQLSGGNTLKADEYVIATGAWTSKVASQLGDYLPIEAMAGYNTTIGKPGVSIKHPLLHHTGGFVLTPMEMGLRVGGTLELGGLNSKPNFKRAQAIVKKAQKILPNLQISEEKEWVGYRPMTPDTIPVIGRSGTHSNVVYACGHGQMGITYGAITGELVADIIEKGNSDKLDLSPYRATRF